MPPRKAISKAGIEIATGQQSLRRGIRIRKPAQKVLLLQQEAEEKETEIEEPETEESETEEPETEEPEIEELETGEIEVETETEETEEEITKANNDLAKELKQAFKNLTLEEIQTRIPNRKKVQFKPFDQGYQRDCVTLIPNEVDPKDSLQLLDLFISSETYELIAININKYAETKESLIIAAQSNKRIWVSTTAAEIRVFFGICIYMGVHQESRYQIYW